MDGEQAIGCDLLIDPAALLLAAGCAGLVVAIQHTNADALAPLPARVRTSGLSREGFA